MIHNMTGSAVHYWSGELSALASRRKDLRLLPSGQSEKLMVRGRGTWSGSGQQVHSKGGRKDLRLLPSGQSEKLMVRGRGTWPGSMGAASP